MVWNTNHTLKLEIFRGDPRTPYVISVYPKPWGQLPQQEAEPFRLSSLYSMRIIVTVSNTPFTRYYRLSNRLNNRSYRVFNRLNNRLNVCLHDAARCSSGC